MRFSMTKFYKHVVINVDKKRVVHRKYRKYKGTTISNNTAGWSNSDDNSLQCHSSWGWMMLVLVAAGWFLKKRKLRIKDRKDSTWPSISNNRAGRSNSIKKLKVPTSILCSHLNSNLLNRRMQNCFQKGNLKFFLVVSYTL